MFIYALDRSLSQLGGFEIATVLDAKAIREGLYPHYGANASADEVQTLARANNIDTRRFEHPNIPTLVNTGKQLVLFDTGNGALPREYEQLSKRLPPGQTAPRLAAAGYRPEDIDVIVITHGHPDHIGGLVEGGKPVFPNANYVFGATEFDFWKRGENVREARKFNRELFVKSAFHWLIVRPSLNQATRLYPALPP
jgi:glyoxylase-like metal-dependent hydrolase (beta-lactamase superfamily II)